MSRRTHYRARKQTNRSALSDGSSPDPVDITPVTTWVTNMLLPNLTCGVCLDVLCEPVSLPCAHTFCRACWENVRNFACPNCRTKYTGDVEVNRIINTMVGVLPMIATCGAKMLRRDGTNHASTCVTCLQRDFKYTRFQLVKMRQKLRKTRKRNLETANTTHESSSDDDDDPLNPF